MKIFSEKRRFVRTFCAISLATLTVCSSLVSVAADISGAAGTDEDPAPVVTVSSAPAVKKVVLDINGAQRTVLFAGKTVGDLLNTTRTVINDNRMVIPDIQTKVTPFMVVSVRDVKPVEVTADGKTETVRLPCGTVQDSLKLAGISLGGEDILSVSRTARVETIDKLTIQRVTYREETKTESVSYNKEKQNTDTLELGETKLGTKGQNGEKQVTGRIKYIDGKAVSEKVISEKVTKQPVNEVTLVGTKGAGTTGGAGTFTDVNGVKVAYKEVLTGSGTAYTAGAGACTATGVAAYRGGVAVNPDIIPYGSKLYVVSTDGSVVYGYCTAVDTGGALMDGSAIVDCFYDTYDECINFGRRDVNVYVIA